MRSPSFAARAPTTWLIGHLISPLQRWLFRSTGGRLSLTGRAPVLLLTTTGRKTGKRRTVPLFYIKDGNALVVCNVRPPSERPNPWPMNLRADPRACVELGRERFAVNARSATSEEVEIYWPRLTRIWPPYEAFYQLTGQRSIFVLNPTPTSAARRTDRGDVPSSEPIGDDRIPQRRVIALLPFLPGVLEGVDQFRSCSVIKGCR